jgi:hypothetical protein
MKTMGVTAFTKPRHISPLGNRKGKCGSLNSIDKLNVF